MPNSQADVTAGAPNLEAYTDHADGTVTDNDTGLMWQQAVPSGAYTTAAEAVAYCSTLTLAGHSDWRLPSMIELYSIVDLGQSAPSINGTYFPSTPSNSTFWSSSPAACWPNTIGSSPPSGSVEGTWHVNFADGNTSLSESSHLTVRCVR